MSPTFDAIGHFASAEALPVGLWRWPHIHPAREFACHGDGSLLVVPDFLDVTEELRKRCGFPFRFTSFYRSPDHNDDVSSTGRDGPHVSGRAFDVALAGTHVVRLVAVALDLGFTGIGLKQHGPYASRFIHLDNLTTEKNRVRPLIWTYS